MRVIDLIPPEVIARREAESRMRQWAKRLAMAALTGVVLFAGLYRLAEGRNSELSRLAEKYGSLEGRLQRAGALLEERARLARNREAVALLQNEGTAGHLLEILDRTLIPEGYLTSLDVERCPLADPGAPPHEDPEPCFATMRIRGLAAGHKEVGHLIRNMISSGAFSDVALVSSRHIEHSSDPRKVEFEILCVLSGEGSTPDNRRYGTLEAEQIHD